ncbi:MAG: glycerol-3-phosphate 1-O-acyltransferase PlsY [Proteobacteria bacterium]|nr:glycerol-3-phosphate 1-O-acyltransferase PlsY [Pseudomonadota bacterium]
MSIILTHMPILWSAIFLAFAGGYLSGSIPYGLLLGKLCGLGDIRKYGSGNIGATNVLRLGGKKLALITLLLDGLKGTLPVLIAKQVHMDYAIVAALGAFIGHLFPLWLRFKGGKGVAVALGISFALSWQLGLALCLIWLTIALISHYSSLSALSAFALSPLVAIVVTHSYQVTTTMLLMTLMVWAKHHANIQRLIDGTEGKISFKKTTTP